jgi:hypothetical protein
MDGSSGEEAPMMTFRDRLKLLDEEIEALNARLRSNYEENRQLSKMLDRAEQARERVELLAADEAMGLRTHGKALPAFTGVVA